MACSVELLRVLCSSLPASSADSVRKVAKAVIVVFDGLKSAVCFYGKRKNCVLTRIEKGKKTGNISFLDLKLSEN